MIFCIDEFSEKGLQDFLKISRVRKIEDDGGTLKRRSAIPAVLVLLLLVSSGIDGWGAAIRDIGELNQNPLAYVRASDADLSLLPPARQDEWNAISNEIAFLPWHQSMPRHTLEQVTWGFKEYGEKTGYGKDGRRHPADWVRKMVRNAHLEDYPQGGFPAIAVRRIDFRVLPTRESHSFYPRRQGQNNPFDSLQESSAPAGTPVLVTQISRDREWLLTETGYALGWVPVKDLAKVDSDFIRSWECGRYAAIVRDRVPVQDEKGVALSPLPLGALFPKIGEESDRIWIMTAERDSQGNARLRKAWIPKDAAADKPLPLTPRNVARLAAELSGQPYGWGGMDGKRDCSALIRDIFTPFGIWLPRNSREQAEAGRFVSLRDLASAEREARIAREGIPWRTLLWTPGHIMLYIGVHQGRPLIFHSFWSVKTRDAKGNRGKIIVGRAAVTTLRPGRELSGPDLPRNDVEVMTFLGEPPEDGVSLPGGTP